MAIYFGSFQTFGVSIMLPGMFREADSRLIQRKRQIDTLKIFNAKYVSLLKILFLSLGCNTNLAKAYLQLLSRLMKDFCGV